MERAEGKDILLIEDNYADAYLAEEAFKTCGSHHRLYVVQNGDQAIRYLKADGEFAGQTKPDLIILDLNMPRKDGRELLAEIKTYPEFAGIPVVVFSSSRSEADVKKCYELKCCRYIIKPVALEEYMNAVREIDGFLLSL